MSIENVVIVGAGHAGFQVAASLRQEGFQGQITLVSNEPGMPYQRPPLSKAYMLGKLTRDALAFRPATFLEQQRITLLHDEVTTIDRAQKQVTLASAGHLRYDHLVLAPGAANRTLPVPGAELQGVSGVKTLADADFLAPLVTQARNVVVVGAGFIGLEFAAVAAAQGATVTVVELADRLMGRAVSPVISDVFRQAHEGWGVRFEFKQGLQRIDGQDGKVCGVTLSDGRQLPADLVVYGIGVIPHTRLATDAGLTVSNGIQVNELMQTSDPDISAVGDVVSFPSPFADAPIRLESVQNALDQARALAARLMGKPAAYAALPWFWSDQGDLKLQIVGLSTGFDNTVTVGDVSTRQFAVLCFKGDTLLAVETCNKPADHMVGRRLLAKPCALTPAVASAPGFELKAWEAANKTA